MAVYFLIHRGNQPSAPSSARPRDTFESGLDSLVGVVDADSADEAITLFSDSGYAPQTLRAVSHRRAIKGLTRELRNYLASRCANITAHEHEIGGLSVTMTREQAARWNAAETTEEDQDTIMVTLPDQYVQATSISNGEIVMGGTKLVEHSHQITLREAYDRPDLAEMLDGCEAVLIPARASSRRTRRGYQIHSSADNTGWEGEIFHTMAEANLAIKTWQSIVGGRHTYDVVRVDSAPTITFAQWNSEPIN